MNSRARAWLWVPPLYFAEGLPFVLISSVSLVMFSNFNVPVEKSLLWVNLFALPWTLRPLWVPLIDRIGTPRRWAVIMQLILAAVFGSIGAAVAAGASFEVIASLFFAAAFFSATYDSAADGYYIVALDNSGQAFFSGIRSAIYKLGSIAGQGGLAIIAGWSVRTGLASVHTGWAAAYIAGGLLLGVISLFNAFAMPEPPAAVRNNETPEAKSAPLRLMQKGFFRAYWDFFTRPGVFGALAFLLFFRLAEAQLKVAVPFMLAAREEGGLGIGVEAQGLLYGTFGMLALTAGGLLSGILVSRQGIRKWIWPMALAINVPDLVYVYLAFYQPHDLWLIGSCVFVEQFGYGFGYTLVTLYMVWLAGSRKHDQTSFFALMTALVSLGLMVTGMLSGYMLTLPARLLPEVMTGSHCYRIFFIWVLVCTIPSFAVTALVAGPLAAGFDSGGGEDR